MAKKPETTDEAKLPAQVANAALPAHLQQGKTAKVGNTDSSDLILPRVKLLQAISPEIVESNLEWAKAGQFWHTIAAEPMGDSVRVIPVVVRKSLVLWSPRNDDRGILARSKDTINWDPGFANMEFEVKPKGVAKAFKINTGDNVKSSFIVGDDSDLSLADFGSGIPGDPKSAPMASLTYNWLFYFPDFPQFSPAIVINTRSAVKASQLLLSKIEQRPVDHYGQAYKMIATDEMGAEGPYKGYGFQADGWATEEEFAITKAMFGKFGDADWMANDEVDEGGSPGGSGGGDTGTKKF